MKESMMVLRTECEEKGIAMAVIGYDFHGNANIRLEKNDVVAWLSERDDRWFAGGTISKAREKEYYDEYVAYCTKRSKYDSCFVSGIGWWLFEEKQRGNHDHSITEIMSYFERA